LNEIRDGINKIINEDTIREDLITKGYENAKRFSLDKIKLDYLNLYIQVKDSI